MECLSKFHELFEIPLGIDPAPLLANLFMYAYEMNYITDLISLNMVEARHFHPIFIQRLK